MSKYYIQSDKYKFLYVYIPKNGSVSILKWFNGIHNRSVNLRGMHARTISEFSVNNINKEFKTFVVIRNPYERFVSAMFDKYHNYLSTITSSKETDTFLNLLVKCKNKNLYSVNEYFSPQSKMIGNIKKFDYVYDLNELNEKFPIFCKDLNIPYNKIPIIHINKKKKLSKKNIIDLSNVKISELVRKKSINYNNLINNKTKPLLYNMYKDDFELFKSWGINYV